MLAKIKPKTRESVYESGRKLIESARQASPDPEHYHGAEGPSSSAPLKTGLTAQAHLEQLEKVLAQVDALWKSAFAAPLGGGGSIS